MPLDPATSRATVSVDEIDGKSPNSDKLITESTKRRRASDESTLFNTSDRKSKNCATFYFKHRDTDSEADCQHEEELTNNMDDSSEEEWTYTASPTDNCQTTIYEEKESNVVVRLDFDEKIDLKHEIVELKNEEMKIVEEDDEEGKENLNDDEIINKNNNCESEDDTKHDIKKLIHEVEKLVSEDGKKNIQASISKLNFDNQGQNNYRAKYTRIKEWLKLNSINDLNGRSVAATLQLDSCDASGEYTTGESDIEKQSETSEDIQSSVATYRRCDGSLGCVSQSVSQEIYNENEKTLINDCNQNIGIDNNSASKVVMRVKKKSDGKRPWSVSCVFGQLNTTNDSGISQFSISETALHQLVASTPLKSTSLDA